jgi:hypothetical protein
MSNDASLMISAGVNFNGQPNVRDELTRHLLRTERLVDSQVDGKNSVPYQKDQSNSRFGRMLACRRIARTIMLGSAPSVKEQTVRVLKHHASVLALFNLVRTSLFSRCSQYAATSLAYLYTNPPTIDSGTTHAPRSARPLRIAPLRYCTEVDFEIERRLRTNRKEVPFSGVHVARVISRRP